MAGRNDTNTKGPDAKKRTVVIIALFALFLLVVVFALPSIVWQTGAVQPSREQIISRLAGKGIAAVGEPIITKIAAVDELKGTKPVIYKNAMDGQYEVKWQTLLVIYDYERDEVVNMLSITPVQIG